MRYIERKEYLQKLKDTVETEDIKVITGIRRSGKSCLMEAFIDYVEQNIPDSNIIRINFNELDFENLTEYHALNNYVMEHYIPEQQKRNMQQCLQNKIAKIRRKKESLK